MALVFKKRSLKNTGSIIKATEKEMEWVVLVNNKSYYTIIFTFNELNNLKVLKLNEVTLLKAKITKENLNHAFQIENLDFTIKYDKATKTFQLQAYGIDIESYSEENLKKQVIQQQVKPHMQNFQGVGSYNSNVAMSPQQMQSNQYAQGALSRAYSNPQAQQQQPPLQQQQQQPVPQNQLMPIDQQLQNADNLVQMFDDVIDSCKANTDVIESEDLKELKKSILSYQTSLTQCLNLENMSESIMDRLLKMLDKINHSVRYYDKICTKEIIIDNVDYGASRAIFNKQNNNMIPPKKEENQQKNGVLLVQYNSESSNSDEELVDPYKQKINHQYPQQPESQVLFYQKQQQPQQQQQQQNQQNVFQYPPSSDNQAQGNKVLFPSLPPQQLKQYPQVKLNEQVSPQPLNNSIKNPQLKSKISEENQCIICMNDESTHTLIPCGHKKYCASCADEMVKQKQCAFCRKPCQQSMRIFD